MNEYDQEIYNMIRNTFHSQSGYFLYKSEAYDVMLKVKEIFEKRDMNDIFADEVPNEELKKATERYKQRELLKQIMKDDEQDGLYDESFDEEPM